MNRFRKLQDRKLGSFLEVDKPTVSGRVYIFQAKDTSLYKIGYTTLRLEERLDALQTGCPFPLLILAFFPGTQVDERELHRQLAPYRMQGEWFNLPGYVSYQFADFLLDMDVVFPTATREGKTLLKQIARLTKDAHEKGSADSLLATLRNTPTDLLFPLVDYWLFERDLT